jgi:hypothetical protein
MPVTRDEERPQSDARRNMKGNQNALKHGRYTADAIAKRREIGALVRAMRTLIREEV